MSFRTVCLWFLVSASIASAQPLKDSNYRGLWAVANPAMESAASLRVPGDMTTFTSAQLETLRRTYLVDNLFKALYEWLPEKYWSNKDLMLDLYALWQEETVVVPLDLPAPSLTANDFLKLAIRDGENASKPNWAVGKLGVFKMKFRPMQGRLFKSGKEVGFAAYAFQPTSTLPVKEGDVLIDTTFEWVGGVYEVEGQTLKFPIVYTPAFKLTYTKPLSIYELPQ